MATSQSKTVVRGVEEVEKTFVQRRGRFLLFFETTWWEEVKTEHVGNDIQIKTDREIRQVYLNGEPLINQK